MRCDAETTSNITNLWLICEVMGWGIMMALKVLLLLLLLLIRRRRRRLLRRRRIRRIELADGLVVAHDCLTRCPLRLVVVVNALFVIVDDDYGRATSRHRCLAAHLASSWRHMTIIGRCYMRHSYLEMLMSIVLIVVSLCSLIVMLLLMVMMMMVMRVLVVVVVQ